MNEKKTNQLGMNYSTAYNRLIRDIIWSLIVDSGRYRCCRCNEFMTREDYTIEHIEPWQDTEDPVKLFFSLENIGFSHHKCNMEHKRRHGFASQAVHGTSTMYERGCRCDPCKQASSEYRKSKYTIEKRRKKYLKNGY